MRVTATRVKLTGQRMGGAERHLPDQYRNHGMVITPGTWNIFMNVTQDTQYHRISWNARLTMRELSPARTSMSWKAQTIKGVVMGGDSQDKAGNFKFSTLR